VGNPSLLVLLEVELLQWVELTAASGHDMAVSGDGISHVEVVNVFNQGGSVNVGRINALELGITSKKTTDAPPAKVVVLLGADNFRHDEIPEDAFVYADLILPTSSYLEKTGTFVNTDGRPQQTRAALSSPGFSQHDWMGLRALSEELGTPLPYDTIDELRTRLAELAPHLLKYDVIEGSGFEELAHKPNGDTNVNLRFFQNASVVDEAV